MTFTNVVACQIGSACLVESSAIERTRAGKTLVAWRRNSEGFVKSKMTCICGFGIVDWLLACDNFGCRKFLVLIDYTCLARNPVLHTDYRDVHIDDIGLNIENIFLFLDK